MKNEKQISRPIVANDRLRRYEVRDAHHGFYNGIGNKIYEHKFCPMCRSNVCAIKEHLNVHMELHPALRIPKKTASVKKWKQFLQLVENFGESNQRIKRH